MDEFNIANLKSWRKGLKISQNKLAEISKVSLPTIRKIESGRNKPQKRTLDKLLEAVKSAGNLVPFASSESTPAAPKKTAGKAPKKGAEKAAQPKPVEAAQQPAPAAKKPGPKGKPAKSAEAQTPAQRQRRARQIELTNLDLELITRILNMKERDKLNLLAKLI